MPLMIAFAKAELADQKVPSFSWHLRTNHHLNHKKFMVFGVVLCHPHPNMALMVRLNMGGLMVRLNMGCPQSSCGIFLVFSMKHGYFQLQQGT